MATIAESIPKALAAFHDKTSTEVNPTAGLRSDSEDSQPSDQEEVTRKCSWKGDSVSAGKVKAPAKSLKLSFTRPTQATLDPLEGSTSNTGNPRSLLRMRYGTPRWSFSPRNQIQTPFWMLRAFPSLTLESSDILGS
ncbi:Hypothetical predicted protein [Pelobates cultripes]|uniref:Uncharacterized protein n=1 Tax=Pelobates cultripes TaxID=61616 RepID=A0AAD1RFB7_PELCU|nr:Hypothetical predicted protein [Pelobates cultripes]